jgi:hypothetical protein
MFRNGGAADGAAVESAYEREIRSQNFAVSVRALGLGEIYGYSGTFTYELRAIAEHPTG